MDKTLSTLEKQTWGLLAAPGAVADRLEAVWRKLSPRQALHRFRNPVELVTHAENLRKCDFLVVVADSSHLIHALRDTPIAWDRVAVVSTGSTPLLVVGHPEGVSFVHASESAEEILPALASHAQRYVHELYDREVAQARASGMLRLLAFLTGGSLAETFERARIACSLAQFHADDPHVIRRTTRLALYRNLPEVPGWKDVTNPAAKSVEQLLEKTNALLPDQPWPADTPIETVLAETARLASEHARGSEKDFRELLKRLSAQLPFGLRTSIRNAADRVLRTLWERKYDVA
ncbi:MAG: hypothetical protein HUU37_00930 [Bdellovibrionales bacterium]|nr:hypothetical protein [Bdellovibrionales bacterium]